MIATELTYQELLILFFPPPQGTHGALYYKYTAVLMHTGGGEIEATFGDN